MRPRCISPLHILHGFPSESQRKYQFSYRILKCNQIIQKRKKPRPLISFHFFSSLERTIEIPCAQNSSVSDSSLTVRSVGKHTIPQLHLAYLTHTGFAFADLHGPLGGGLPSRKSFPVRVAGFSKVG